MRTTRATRYTSKPMPKAAAEATFDSPSAPRPIRALPVDEVEAPSLRETVLRKLAADRLRDLRDDGLTLAYVARMYGVDAREMEQISTELVPTGRR